MANANKRVGRMPLIAGNWKMNLNHLEAIALVQKLAFSLAEPVFDRVEVVVIPPYTDLRSVQTLVDGDRLLLKYGAQDLSAQTAGAYTGEISGPMLAKLGCSYVVIGHSERRQYHGETDELVNAKVKAAYAVEITPILCVGEGLEIRESGEHVAYTLAQLDGALAGVTRRAGPHAWSSPTSRSGRSAPARWRPRRTRRRCARAIRTRLAELYSGAVADGVRVLYGGSVKADNAGGIMAQPDVDGALVGGASIDADSFAGIVTATADSP